MANIESHIDGSEKLIRIHGNWPTFHDAEIIDLHYWRGRMKPGDWDDSNVLPVLTLKIHVFIESPDTRHSLTTIKFKDVDNFKMEGFNHQNAIMGISIRTEERGTFVGGEPLPPYLAVEIKPAFGMGTSFSLLPHGSSRCGNLR
jgi:Immunity protein 50